MLLGDLGLLPDGKPDTDDAKRAVVIPKYKEVPFFIIKNDHKLSFKVRL